MILLKIIWILFSFIVKAPDRDYVIREPMLENLEPSDSYAVTHFPVNALGMTTKFFANYKSAPAYEDGIPKNKRGVQKGPVAAAAYAQERKNLTERVELFLKMKIGTVAQI